MNDVKITDLESFVEDEDLEKLEDIANEFNIFNILRIVKKEIRHSIFLSWLLNPQEIHGLSDYFLKLFLKEVCRKAGESKKETPTIIDIDSWDLNEAEVLTEWHSMDITIKDDCNKFVCVIENKIETGEHSNQLSKYKDIIEKELSEYKKLYVYLTPEGIEPSNDTYISFTYSEINKLVKSILNAKKESLNEYIRLLITHYNKTLERFIMPESEITQLCRKIYTKHRKSLDLIFENRPDIQSDIFDILNELIKNKSNLIPDYSSKSYIRFIPKELDEKIDKKGTGEWVKTNRILLFEFDNFQDKLKLLLIIGPGDDSIRKKIHKISQENNQLFKKTNLYQKFTTIYVKDILKKTDLETLEESSETLRAKIEYQFTEFLNKDMKKINETILKYYS